MDTQHFAHFRNLWKLENRWFYTLICNIHYTHVLQVALTCQWIKLLLQINEVDWLPFSCKYNSFQQFEMNALQATLPLGFLSSKIYCYAVIICPHFFSTETCRESWEASFILFERSSALGHVCILWYMHVVLFPFIIYFCFLTCQSSVFMVQCKL